MRTVVVTGKIGPKFGNVVSETVMSPQFGELLPGSEFIANIPQSQNETNARRKRVAAVNSTLIGVTHFFQNDSQPWF